MPAHPCPRPRAARPAGPRCQDASGSDRVGRAV